MKKLSLILLLLLQLLSGCNDENITPKDPDGYSNNTTITNNDYAPSIPPDIADGTLEFNNTDKDIATNNNRAIAYAAITNTPANGLDSVKRVPISKITKNPYTYLGKLVKLSGKVMEVEQMPPNEAQQGNWYSVLLMVENTNSKMGFTSVNLHYKGDDINADVNNQLTIAGYFVGTYTSLNAFGGEVTGVLIIGNYAK